MTDKKDDPDLQDKDPELVEQHYKQVVDGVREMFDAKRKQPAQQQEPVAWLIWLHGPAGLFDHKQFAELEFERRNKEYPDPDRKLLPLYTHQQRKPLTDAQREEIAKGWRGRNWTVGDIIDAIEAAHAKGDA